MMVQINSNSIYLVGKFKDVIAHLSAIEDKSLTVAEYIKRLQLLRRKSLN